LAPTTSTTTAAPIILYLYDISGSNGYNNASEAFDNISGSGTIAHTICITNDYYNLFYNPSLLVSFVSSSRQPAYGFETGSCTINYTDNIPDRRFYVGEFGVERIVVNYKTDTYNSSSNVFVERMYPQWRSPLLASGSNNVGAGWNNLSCSVITPDGTTNSIYWDDNENPYFGGPFVSGRYTEVFNNAGLTTQYCGTPGSGKYYKVTHSSGSLAGQHLGVGIGAPGVGGRPCSFITIFTNNCN
jgi:hypothetical protein